MIHDNLQNRAIVSGRNQLCFRGKHCGQMRTCSIQASSRLTSSTMSVSYLSSTLRSCGGRHNHTSHSTQHTAHSTQHTAHSTQQPHQPQQPQQPQQHNQRKHGTRHHSQQPQQPSAEVGTTMRHTHPLATLRCGPTSGRSAARHRVRVSDWQCEQAMQQQQQHELHEQQQQHETTVAYLAVRAPRSVEDHDDAANRLCPSDRGPGRRRGRKQQAAGSSRQQEQELQEEQDAAGHRVSRTQQGVGGGAGGAGGAAAAAAGAAGT